MTKSVLISDDIRRAFPNYHAGVIYASVKNSPRCEELWEELDREAAIIKNRYTTEDIKDIPAIAATRNAYKTLGKDPSRYRPSAEALLRRIIKEAGLYKISALVDLINLVSIRTGYSIGGFDADKVNGTAELGVGVEDEEFTAIGRGKLNIAGLPVFRDETGCMGTPTSDEIRTSLSPETKHILIIINAYSGPGGLQEAVKLTVELLKKYAFAEGIETSII